MYKIKWKGCNKAQNIWWNKKANSYSELWDLLLVRNLVHEEQIIKDGHELIEEEYKDIIKSCDSNAYYQWFYEWDEDKQDYIEV